MPRVSETSGFHPGDVPFSLPQLPAAQAPGLQSELRRRLVGWRADLVGTLMLVRDRGRLLLIHKKRGHGAGRISAPGGKREPGESALQCAVRETQEEVGVRVRTAALVADLKFVERHGEQWRGYVFLAGETEGGPRETGEAKPHWFALHALPYHRMWEDSRLWLPEVLAGRFVQGAFLFNAGALVAHDLRSASPAQSVQ